jgi:hypothetical protein
MLKLSGRRMKIYEQRVRFGSPKIFLLKPSANLYARCVTIKNCFTPDRFLNVVAMKLDEPVIKASQNAAVAWHKQGRFKVITIPVSRGSTNSYQSRWRFEAVLLARSSSWRMAKSESSSGAKARDTQQHLNERWNRL